MDLRVGRVEERKLDRPGSKCVSSSSSTVGPNKRKEPEEEKRHTRRSDMAEPGSIQRYAPKASRQLWLVSRTRRREKRKRAKAFSDLAPSSPPFSLQAQHPERGVRTDHRNLRQPFTRSRREQTPLRQREPRQHAGSYLQQRLDRHPDQRAHAWRGHGRGSVGV